MNNLITDTQNRMKNTCDRLVSEYASIQAGRANPAVLDKITVDYYGSPTPINPPPLYTNLWIASTICGSSHS